LHIGPIGEIIGRGSQAGIGVLDLEETPKPIIVVSGGQPLGIGEAHELILAIVAVLGHFLQGIGEPLQAIKAS
jgi:hypothetical protein